MPDDSPGLPILRGNYSDPTVVRVGSDYYLTHSCNRYAPAFLIWHSTDLLHWRPLRPALARYGGDIWAPDLAYHDGIFYLYYTSSDGNHVLTAPRIDGPWSEPVDLKLAHIDPGHLAAPDGRRYLYLSTGHLVELTPDGLTARGEIQKVHAGWPFPAAWRTEGFCLESPKPFFRDGWYYLVSAQGGTAGPATSHMVVVARARTPQGPWEESPHNPLLRTETSADAWWSRGHGTMFDTPGGEWWIIYHAYQNGYRTLGRMNLLESIDWTPDGWPRRGTRVPDGARAASLGYADLSDDFTGPELGWQWQFLGEWNPARFRFDHGLRLAAGGATIPEGSAPLSLLPRHRAYRAEVDLELEDDATEAGLLLFYDPAHYVGLALNARGIVLARPSHNPVLRATTGCRQVSLRVVNDHHDVEFWARLPGGDWEQMPLAFEVSAWHHNALGGYNSLRVALYAAGGGAASFRRFIYQPLSD